MGMINSCSKSDHGLAGLHAKAKARPCWNEGSTTRKGPYLHKCFTDVTERPLFRQQLPQRPKPCLNIEPQLTGVAAVERQT